MPHYRFGLAPWLATTDGRVTVRPRNIAGKLTLTIDPKFACQIRGMATDGNGNRIPGANVKLWWGRPYASQTGNKLRRVPSPISALIRDQRERLVRVPRPLAGVRIRGRGRGRRVITSRICSTIMGQSGETHDVGKIVLFNTTRRLVGRVVGSDGRPVSDAVVFNRGDSRETAATSTDARGAVPARVALAGNKVCLYSQRRISFHRRQDR